MFGAMILVCGLASNPELPFVDGCTLLTNPTPFRSEAECMTNIEMHMPNVEAQMPPGAYIADVTCAQLDKQT